MAKSPLISKNLDEEQLLSELNNDNTIQYLSMTSITNRMEFLQINF